MDDLDIPETPPIRGQVARTWRWICHSRQNRRQVQNQARRRMRRAVRQAIRKGDGRDVPQPFTAWDVA